MGAELLTDNEIENLKMFSDKRIVIKILHSYGKTKEEICEILGIDPDVVEDTIRV